MQARLADKKFRRNRIESSAAATAWLQFFQFFSRTAQMTPPYALFSTLSHDYFFRFSFQLGFVKIEEKKRDRISCECYGRWWGNETSPRSLLSHFENFITMRLCPSKCSCDVPNVKYYVLFLRFIFYSSVKQTSFREARWDCKCSFVSVRGAHRGISLLRPWRQLLSNLFQKDDLSLDETGDIWLWRHRWGHQSRACFTSRQRTSAEKDRRWGRMGPTSFCKKMRRRRARAPSLSKARLGAHRERSPSCCCWPPCLSPPHSDIFEKK